MSSAHITSNIVTVEDTGGSTAVTEVQTNITYGGIIQTNVVTGGKGEDGVSGDKNYTETFTNSDTVVVDHNLNKYPAITVINSANDEVVGEVEYNSINQITIRFSGSFSGRVTCN